MIRKISITILILLAAVLALGCKRTKFTVAEEVNQNIAIRYTTTDSYYLAGKSIALKQSKFQLIPADSMVLFFQGNTTKSADGGQSIAQLQLARTARFYATLPVTLKPGKYDITFKSICEIVGSLNYQEGEGLFTCQSGQVVVDSLKKGEIFGSVSGTYRNTKNQSLKISGAIKARVK